uniref:Uncharacterized protein n=1 Tax=uncultured marine virus TaxID=186617 RepID=A0A0F7L3W1_9VIRU|nr:hypothetical protein [uncultured marine virus]
MLLRHGSHEQMQKRYRIAPGGGLSTIHRSACLTGPLPLCARIAGGVRPA